MQADPLKREARCNPLPSHCVYSRTQHNSTLIIRTMSYEESFLSTCNAEGQAPAWAIKQIFSEHGSDFNEYTEQAGKDWDQGQAILNWLGY